jgi:hypothetical protein
MKLTNLITEILTKNPSLSGTITVRLKDEKIEFSLPGFSKSGDIWLSENKDGIIFAEARYEEITEIETYQDIVWIAWDWFLRYADRETFCYPSVFWVDDFKKLGLIEEVKETKFKIKK